MADDDFVWPVGTTAQDPDLADRPVVFRPEGFLVAILTDADEAGRAAAALRTAGFDDRTLRIFTGEQILADYARYTARQGRSRRVVATVVDDAETLQLYHGHARDGRGAPGSRSPTTTVPTAPSAPSPTSRRCTSGTTATTCRRTSVTSAPADVRRRRYPGNGHGGGGAGRRVHPSRSQRRHRVLPAARS